MTQIITNNSGGGGNKNSVIGPSSAVDGDIVIFDGDTGKIIKDSGEKLSNLQVKWIEVNVATANGTAAKVGTTTAGGYTPTKGDFLLVNFVSGCNVDNPTLNIDGSGAKAIRTGNANANKSTFALGTTANSNIKALLYYDGTYYRCWSTTNSNTTYSAMSVAEGKTGTATSSRAMRADYLKQIIKYHAVSDTAYDSTWDGATGIAPSQNAVYDKIESLNIPTKTSDLNNDSGYITSEDLSGYQTKANLVTSLSGADNDHYPSAKAVADAITSAGGGDMLKSVYDPNNVNANAFDYNNFINTPTIPTVNNATLKIQKNGTDVATFTANASTGVTADISVPTKVSDLSNDSGFVTNQVDDTAYGSSWDGKTTKAPSQNAVYDKISAMDTTISSKAADSDVVKLTGNQTIAGTKTFSTSPVVPSKTTDAKNTGTAIATEAQVYKKQDKLTAQTVYTSKGTATKVPTITTNSLGQVTNISETSIAFPVTSVNGSTGAVTVNDVKVSATAPASPTEGMVWYDTTNDELKVYDGTNWKATGSEYSAGEGISIGSVVINGRQGPAPKGFHVPSVDEWVGLKTLMDNGGLSSGNDLKTNLYMPFSGCRYDDGEIDAQGTEGRYWSSSPFSGGTGLQDEMSYYLSIATTGYAEPIEFNIRSYGYSIRCFKDVPVEIEDPTNPGGDWDLINNVGIGFYIFHSPSLGVITIMYRHNGREYITIADKNLGATTVYNDGDTLSEANCGKYYQWGNNYGFPWTGAITTSSTQVDASGYGPGNYYSSDTFITGSADWSSVRNPNLWGDITGTITQDAISNTGVLSVNGQTGNITIETFQLAPNSPLTPKYRRYGTQAQYDALAQYYTDEPGDTVYFTI